MKKNAEENINLSICALISFLLPLVFTYEGISTMNSKKTIDLMRFMSFGILEFFEFFSFLFGNC
jgi:hypothetical protein